jgi:DNA end-binding protein Ku
MKSVWSGSISFGLVAIAVKLYSVAQEHILGFRMLCKTCNTPLKMLRWCSHCKKEVSWHNVVKGLEIEKGRYIVLTQETLKSLKPLKTDAISILSFVNAQLVDPVYFNTHYYLAPASAPRPYTLLQHALQATGKVAIGRFVMRDREHMCMIQSYHTGLLLTTLYYDYEVRHVDKVRELQAHEVAVTSGELKLAKQLIDQMSHKTLDLTEYKETFAQEIKKLIKKKTKGKVVTLEKPKATRKSRETQPSLTDMLKESLGHSKRAARK